MSELFDRVPDKRVDLFQVAQSGLDELSPTAGLGHLIHGAYCGLSLNINQDHRRTMMGKLAHYGLTDPGGPSGHDGDIFFGVFPRVTSPCD